MFGIMIKLVIFRCEMEACWFCAIMVKYLALSNIPSIMTTAPVPAEEKQSYSIMLAPLCFIMGMVLFELLFVSFCTKRFAQNYGFNRP